MTIRTYFFLTKPGIIFGNAITAAGGFALASKNQFDLWLFIATIIGLSFIVASGCVFNNYIDREADEKMTRTKNRALATGTISLRNSIIFAVSLLIMGGVVLALFSNLLAWAIALFGFFVYVFIYSFSKYRSTHGTLIGSIAGAVPPVVGYCAASGVFDLGALILFLIIALWQMPHFFAIAIYRIQDYAAASIPVLPIKKGIFVTKIHMLLYIAAFMSAASLLFVFDYVGYIYLGVAALFGLSWLILCIKGFKCANDQIWARRMFLCSLVVVMGLCLAIPMSVTS